MFRKIGLLLLFAVTLCIGLVIRGESSFAVSCVKNTDCVALVGSTSRCIVGTCQIRADIPCTVAGDCAAYAPNLYCEGIPGSKKCTECTVATKAARCGADATGCPTYAGARNISYCDKDCLTHADCTVGTKGCYDTPITGKTCLYAGCDTTGTGVCNTCPPATPYWRSGSCRACHTNGVQANCAVGQICSSVENWTCVECATNVNCQDGENTVCSGGTCIPCSANKDAGVASADCSAFAGGTAPFCITYIGIAQCRSTMCVDDTNCANSSTGKTECSGGVCVAPGSCALNADCADASSSKCEVPGGEVFGTCVPCSHNENTGVISDDCTHIDLGSKRYCQAGVCKGYKCSSDADCASNPDGKVICDTVNVKCIECLTNANCTNYLESACSSETCGPCAHNNDTGVASDDCSHIAGKPYCAFLKCAATACATDANCANNPDGKTVCTGGSCELAAGACITNADCTDASLSKCDGGTCVSCTNNKDTSMTSTDCSHIAGKAYCNSIALHSQCQEFECTLSNNCVNDPGFKICHMTNSTCEQCLTNADCPTQMAPKCDLFEGKKNCLECTDNINTGLPSADCSHIRLLGIDYPYCAGVGMCYQEECSDNAHCANNPDGKTICDPGSDTCVAPSAPCVTNDDCTNVFTSKCDGGFCVPCTHNNMTGIASNDCSHIDGGGLPYCQGNACNSTACTMDEECANGPDGRVKCDTTPGVYQCVECRNGYNMGFLACEDFAEPKCNAGSCEACAAPTPYWNFTTGQCVGCLIDAHCASGSFCDNATLTCQSCPVDSYWNSVKALCVECVNNTHCGYAGRLPTCDVNNGVCVSCPPATPIFQGGACRECPADSVYNGLTKTCVCNDGVYLPLTNKCSQDYVSGTGMSTNYSNVDRYGRLKSRIERLRGMLLGTSGSFDRD